MKLFAWGFDTGFANSPAAARSSEALVSAWHPTVGKRAIRAVGAGFVGGTKSVGDHKATGSEQVTNGMP